MMSISPQAPADSASVHCAPDHCRGHPACPNLHCEGHPQNDPADALDPSLRSRFWMTYLGVLMIVFGVLVLWWIR